MVLKRKYHVGIPSAIFISTFTIIVFLTISHAQILLYNKVNFTGDEQDFTGIENCINLDLSKGPPLSLKTSKCFFVYSEERCHAWYLRDESRLSVKIPPGDYPDFSRFLKNMHFPCGVKSIQSCDTVVPAEQKPGIFLDDILWKVPMELPLAELNDICGCVNLPRLTYERVRQMHSKHCIALFSEPNCRGNSLQIPGGKNAAGMDLRVVAFNGLAKSFGLCEDVPACRDANGTAAGYIRTQSGFPIVFTNSENLIEESLQPSHLVVNPDTVNRSVCMNTTSYTCSTSCGGVLNSEKGAIHYKLKESLEPFQRCVWIVRAASNRSKLDVNVVWQGFKPMVGRAEVLISGYENGESFSEKVDYAPKHIKFNGPLMLITLYTEEILATHRGSNGFILEYSTVMDSEEFPVSPFSSDHTINFGEAFSYPPHQTQPRTYSPYELSTFLLLPSPGVMQMGTKYFKFEINKETLDLGPCCDTLDILAFRHYRQWFDWINYKPIRDKNDECFRYGFADHEDMVLFLLRSNSSTPGSGFSITSGVIELLNCAN